MKKILPFLLLGIVVFAAYAPALRDGFVWDDTALVLRDPLIRSPRLIAEGFQHFLFTDATASDFYRPIQRLTYTLEYAAFGLNPAAYHATNIFCHFAAALALLLFARELLCACGMTAARSERIALIAALIWAVHPVHSSAVVYVSGRADPLAAMFGFGGLYLALRSLRVTDRQRLCLTSACAPLFLLSALSKESGLIFPVLALALVFFFQRKGALRSAAVAAIVAVSYLSLRLPAEHIPPPTPHTLPLLVRPILFSRAIAEYAGLLIFPATLRMERDVATHPDGFGAASLTGASLRELQTLAGIVLMAAFFYWLWRERKRERAAFFALLAAAITYLPVSGVVSLNASVAEHWLYVPSAFLILAAIICSARVPSIFATISLQRVALPAAALLVVLLGGRAFVRTFDWKDQRTFLERTIASGSDTARMQINLATLDIDEGKYDAARVALTNALAKEPDLPFAVINRAALAIKQNDFATAHEFLARAVKMPLVEAHAYEMLAVLEFKETGHANLMRVRLASRTGAPDWEIEKRYVKLLAEGGANEAALGELQHCLGTQWYRADSWQLLAQLAAANGHRAEALAALGRAEAYDVRLHERSTAF